MAVMEVLGAVVLAGTMGMLGQGTRAVVGLKKLNDENALKPPGEADAFIASRLLVSLFVGFIAGIAGGIGIGLKELSLVTLDNLDILMGIAAVGYAGTDAIEGFVLRLKGSSSPASGTLPAPSASVTLPAPEAPVILANADLEESIADVTREIASLKSMLLETAPAAAASSSPSPDVEAVGDVLDNVTADDVKKVFVAGTPLSNIKKHLPNVVKGLRDEGLADRDMLLMSLGTIRAETEGFAPISEFKSKFNTDKTPFDLYDKGTAIGKRLGNSEKGDGPKFRGRGFIQLTGRDNYTRIGADLGLDLVNSPDMANNSIYAGRILARFLKRKEQEIRAALAENDLKLARKLVNGGSHGLERFVDAFTKGKDIFT